MDKDGTKKLVGKPTGKKTKADRMVYKTSDGEFVSEKSTTFEYGGKWINVPTIHNGYEYDQDELNIMLEHNVIKPTSIHDNIKEAEEAAKERSFSLMDMAKGGAVTMDNQMGLFAEGGFNDQGGTVDEVSGNEVPVGSLKEEVRDDIPANVSEGEFVLPADVVRYFGLAKLMKMRDEAKSGLAKMEDMGQMGNSDEVTVDKNMPFSMEDLDVEDEEGNSMEFADGGYVRKFQVGGYNPATNTRTSDNTGISTTSAPIFGTNPILNASPFAGSVAAPVGGFTYQGQPVKKLTTPKAANVLSNGVLPVGTVKKTYRLTDGSTVEIAFDAIGNPLTTIPLGATLVSSPGSVAPVVATPALKAPIAPTVKQDNTQTTIAAPIESKEIKWDTLDTEGVMKIAASITDPKNKALMFAVGAIPGMGPAMLLAGRLKAKSLNKALLNEYAKVATLETEDATTQKNELQKYYYANKNMFSKITSNIFGTDPQTLQQLYEQRGRPPYIKPKIKKESAKVTAVKKAASALYAAHGNQKAIQESLNSKRTGTTVDGIVNITGRVSDGSTRGVLADNNGRGVKVKSSGKTVFVGSDGKMYTSGIFGTNKKQVTEKGGVYTEGEKLDTSTGGGDAQSKIVCTAMNESYGFGGFRNLIWLAYARKNLTKEHEVGYHTMFLPLVDIAYKKNNKFVRAILENIARHRTNDLRAEMKKSKRDKIGRLYRFFLEPLCYMVGKIKMAKEK